MSDSTGALQLTHVHDLPDVIRIVRAEIANGVRDLAASCWSSIVPPAFRVSRDRVELVGDVGSSLVAELFERYFVVAGELVILDAPKTIQIVPIPEQQVVSELAH